MSESIKVMRDWVTIAIAVITLVVGITLFIGSRPSREEINAMIDNKTSTRFDRIENQLDEIQKAQYDILKHLANKK